MARIVIFVVVVAALVFALVSLRHWFKQPAVYRGVHWDELPDFIDTFLAQVAAGGLLYVWDESAVRFVQWAMKRDTPSKLRVAFVLPDAPWSRAEFDGIVASLQASEYRCEVRASGETEIPRYLALEIEGERGELAPQLFQLTKGCFDALHVEHHLPLQVSIVGDLRPGSARAAESRGRRTLRRFFG